MIKLAMIGAGGYALYLIKQIWRMPDKIQIIGVASNPQRKSAGRQACVDKGIPIYDTPDEMLATVKGKADVIFIPTPINTHYQLCKKSIDAGFDVFLEKPPVATIQDLDSLRRYAKLKRKRVAVAFQYLYLQILQTLKKRILSGEFGNVRRLSAVAGWYRDDAYFNRSDWAGKVKLNGDWILDGTVNNPLAHLLSAELYLASTQLYTMAEPAAVEAELYHGNDIESEDTSSLRIITNNNIEILFNASLCVDNEINPVIRIYCEKARIEYVGFNSVVINFNDGKTEKLTDMNIENPADETESRVWMLKELIRCYESGDEFAATLESCRPFVVAVNSAFESNGYPCAIDNKHISRFECGDNVKRTIKGINDILESAYNENKLFSEIGVEWARKSAKYDVENYSFFPVKFKK
ncbi:MAG: hypothetical protein A2Y12_01030 [Planctomycetes bacterium GWF2_42_9]|nr:MAG: hypothetical protein A2Y12_01030 [Planctomycetes bacterium GWF2_42_9]